MSDPVLSVSFGTVAAFFESSAGNYRNSIYVSCSRTCSKKSCCSDFLLIPGHDCRPILFPINDAEAFIGAPIDPTECTGTINCDCFIRLYHKWIELTTSSASDCPVHQLINEMNK